MKETDKFITRICCEPQIKNIDGCEVTGLAQEITTMRVKEIDEGIIGQLREIMRIKGITELFAIDESKVMQLVKEHKALEIIKEMRTYKDDIAIAETITDVEESEDFEKFSSRYRNFFSKEEYEILKEVLL